jgi:cytochrome c oxidase assembly protein subunit 15
MSESPPEGRAGIGSAALVSGFGATAAMWSAGYVARLPAVQAPGAVLFVLLVVCLLGGGWYAGRVTGRWTTGLLAGLLSNVVNLLILGSLLASPENPNEVLPRAWTWGPGFLALGLVLGAAGGFVGSRRPRMSDDPSWSGRLAAIAGFTTLLLIGAGGLVTTKGAGMDVPDWPGSFRYNMFLFPLSRMTGGIYYEHAHRLFGTLVGLTSLTLLVYLLRVEARGRVKGFATAIFVLVVIQGIFGGFRVTEDSLALAVIHGVVGQAIFGLILALTAMLGPTWRSGVAPTPTPRAVAERRFGVVLAILLIAQIAIGAILRHYSKALHLHITVGVLAFLAATIVGFRAWGLYPKIAPLRRTGVFLLALAAIQLALGIAALIAVGMDPEHRSRTALATLTITIHQTVGALLIAGAALQMCWTRRLLEPEEED